MKLTIFTPAYNRAHTLTRLYDSLRAQTNKDFEWLIVDDGSTDGTRDLVSRFMEDKQIGIRYVYQENAGKSMAHNKGVELAEGELFTCVDSDDHIVPTAVETVLRRYETLPEGTIGIIAKKGTEEKDLTVTDYRDGDELILRAAYQTNRLSGDTFLVYRASVIRKYAFPRFEGEKFVPEAWLYDRLDEEGRLSYIDEKLCVCEYMSDGYSGNMDRVIARNPKGYRAWAKQRIGLDTGLKEKFLDAVRYESVSFVIRNGFVMPDHKMLSVAALLPGWLLYLKRFRAAER